MEIIRKKNLSKNRLRLQNKDSSSSGVDEMDDEIIRLWQNQVPIFVNCIKVLGLPKENEQIRFITTKSFNALAFVDFILQKEKIVESFFCVYSIDYESGCILNDFANDGKLGDVTFLISNIRNGSYRKKEALIRDKFIRNPKIRLVFCGSHAKLMGFKTENGSCYVIETSANFAPNSRIEQYMFENSQKMFQFHKNWIDKIDQIATDRELAVYDFDGKLIKGSNKFKNYGQKADFR